MGEIFDFRRKQIEGIAATVEGLGIPLRRRSDAPTAYAVNLPPKNITIQAKEKSEEAPAFFLPSDSYEDILDLLCGMSQAFERSQSVFRKITEEEEIRMLLLVPLNGVYDSATGETFNASGKTDILVNHKGKNIFIAECKFWKGPKHFRESIDQLFGYLTWRDCKTSILTFVRETNMQTVLDKIPDLVRSDTRFKREFPSKRQGEFRAEFEGAAGVRLLLTVLCFHIPAPEAAVVHD